MDEVYYNQHNIVTLDMQNEEDVYVPNGSMWSPNPNWVVDEMNVPATSWSNSGLSNTSKDPMWSGRNSPLTYQLPSPVISCPKLVSVRHSDDDDELMPKGVVSLYEIQPLPCYNPDQPYHSQVQQPQQGTLPLPNSAFISNQTGLKPDDDEEVEAEVEAEDSPLEIDEAQEEEFHLMENNEKAVVSFKNAKHPRGSGKKRIEKIVYINHKKHRFVKYKEVYVSVAAERRIQKERDQFIRGRIEEHQVERAKQEVQQKQIQPIERPQSSRAIGNEDKKPERGRFEKNHRADGLNKKFYNPKFILFWGLKKRSIVPGKPYMCPVPDCNRAYKNPNGIKYHARYGHSALHVFTCEFCGKVYTTRHGLLAHNKLVHNKKLAPLPGSSQHSRQTTDELSGDESESYATNPTTTNYPYKQETLSGSEDSDSDSSFTLGASTGDATKQKGSSISSRKKYAKKLEVMDGEASEFDDEGPTPEEIEAAILDESPDFDKEDLSIRSLRLSLRGSSKGSHLKSNGKGEYRKTKCAY